MVDVVSVTAFRPPPPPASPSPVIVFHRRELALVLAVYGRMVARGTWRDYALDHLEDRAVFSVFHRASEVPLLTVEKEPRLARRQGAYSIRLPTGLIVKRGHELAQVLRHFD